MTVMEGWGLDPQDALDPGNLQLLFLPVKLTVLRLVKALNLTDSELFLRSSIRRALPPTGD